MTHHSPPGLAVDAGRAAHLPLPALLQAIPGIWPPYTTAFDPVRRPSAGGTIPSAAAR